MTITSLWLGGVLGIILLSVAISFWRAALGPTPFDRVLAVNTIGTIAVLGIAVHGFFNQRPDFLDIALLYALINFIGTIAVLRFFRFGNTRFGNTEHDDE